MKPYLLYMLLLMVVHRGVCYTIQARNEPECGPDDEFFAPGPECFNFFMCRQGNINIVDCPGGLLWNDEISRCDEAENVICSDVEPPATDAPEPDTTTTEDVEPPATDAPEPDTTTTENVEPPATDAPEPEPPLITFFPETEGALPILFPNTECPPGIIAFQIHATECRRFFYCLNGIRYPQTCPFLQTFNFIVGHCVGEEDKFCFPNSE